MGNTQSWGVLARSRPRATGLVASTLLLGTGFALAAPGDLDPSFNGSGLLSLRVGDYEGYATAVVQQTNGKLVLAGWGRLNGSDNEDFIVMRVAEDGTRDSTFGTNGVASADFTGLWDSATAVIQQSDGKLVLAGEAGGGVGPGKIALARFNADGTLDSTFGSDGRTLVDFGSGTGSRAEDLAQQPDGKLVVVGTTYSGGSSRLVFARFDADGSLDTTFGMGGTTLVDFGSGTSSSAEDLAQQPDGKLVAVGTVVGPGGSNFGIARVSANGALDLSFDGDGLLAVEIVGTAMTVAIQPDDKIVVAGSAYPGATYHSAALLRVNSDGSLDNNFGTFGKTIVDLGNQSDLNSIVVQGDGKLAATGTRYVEGYNMILTRFESDGALDMSFGFDGVATVDFGTGSQAPEAYGVALVQQADGKIVAVGSIEFQPFGAFGAARFDDDAAFAGRIGLTRTVNFVSETTPTVTYTVRRTGGRTGTVSVDFATAAGQAQPGSDFVGASGTLTWNDGDSSDKTLTIDIIDDAVAEKIREDFSLTLSGPTGGAQLAASEGSTTITDADGPGELVFLNQYAWSSHLSATEGDVVIQVPVARLHGSQGAVSVGYQVPNQFSSSTATPGIDFACASGTLSWNDGEADTKYVAVQIIDDTAQETAEFFEIRLVVPGTARTYAGPASRQSIQIRDDGDSGGGGGGGDCESGGGGSSGGGDGSNGGSGGSSGGGGGSSGGGGGGALDWLVALFLTCFSLRSRGSRTTRKASRPRATGLVASALLLVTSVDYATAAGTVPPTSDREDVSGTLTRIDGAADDEPFRINLIDAAVAELDGSGVLSFGPFPGEAIWFTEKNGIVRAVVGRLGGSTGEVSVQYATIADSTATAGADFAATSGTLTWADGDALPKWISVELFDDAAVESDERFRLRLSNPTGGATIRNIGGDQVIVIRDNDPSAPTLSLNKSIVAGCQSVTGRLQLANPAPAGGRVVSLSSTLTSATTPASVTVPGGATTTTFSIKTKPVTSLQSGTITATFGGTVLTRKLSVRRIGMLSVELDRTTVVGTNPVTATAKLECKAAPGPIMVNLASRNAAIADPVAASIVVPQGLQSVPFDVSTSKVLSKRTVSISGTANGIKKSKTLTVIPASFVSPTSLMFGTVPVGATGGPRAATLTNKGKMSFTIGSIGITGLNALSFAMTENCPPILAAGGSCSINVRFKPTVAKSRSATLTIATSASAVPLSVWLSGTGT